MSISFNADEVLEMAKQMERNGATFYAMAAERADDPLTKQLLEDLVTMENEHLQRFDDMKDRWKEAGSLERVFDPDGLALKVLQAWADGQVFDIYAEDPPVTGKEPMADILRTAIRKEKDSVVFYLGLKEAASGEEDCALLDKVIGEEI